jgi:hypothetical protein
MSCTAGHLNRMRCRVGDQHRTFQRPRSRRIVAQGYFILILLFIAGVKQRRELELL